MSDAILIAMIATIPPTIVALLSLRKSAKNADAIQEVHLTINSRMTELLAAKTGEAAAIGEEAGRKKEFDRPKP